MTDLQQEGLRNACVIMGEGLQRAAEALRAAVDAFETAAIAKAAGIEPEAETWGDVRNTVEDLRQLLEEMYAHDKIAEMAELAEEPAAVLPPRIIPRPPKRTGPVNRSNYTANRPPRVARSSCRIIKR